MIKSYAKLIREQLKSNSVALVSLLTALSGLFYDTWRDHRNELNENTRNAAFEVLMSLGELQTIVNYTHFDGNNERGNSIEGWKYVLFVRDLSRLLPQNNMQQSNALYSTWQEHWETLKTNPDSEQKISNSIAKARAEALNTIEHLQ